MGLGDILASNLYLFDASVRKRQRSKCQREGKKKKEKKMVLIDKLWDDTMAGPQPERGLGKLRKMSTQSQLSVKTGNSSGDQYD